MKGREPESSLTHKIDFPFLKLENILNVFQKLPKFSDFTIFGRAQKVYCWVGPLRGSRPFIIYAPNVFLQCMLKPFGCAIATPRLHISFIAIVYFQETC